MTPARTSADAPQVTARSLVGTVAVAVALVVVGWVIGLSVTNAALLGLGGVALWKLRGVPDTIDDDWPERDDLRGDQGARREVARLSWSLQGYESRVEWTSVRRLQRVAAGRLAERGLGLNRAEDAAGCEQLLGRAGYRLLSSSEPVRPTLPEFVATVGVVERLQP